MRVLLLEDDRRTADFVVNGLTAMGYGVDHTDCVAEGAALAARQTYDVIMAGWLDSGLDQRALVSAIRQAENRRPMMLVTGFGGTLQEVDRSGPQADANRQMICSGFMVLS